MYQVSCCTIGEKEQENLTHECHPGRTDKGIEGDENEISHEVGDSDDEIDPEELPLFVVGDEEVGEEGREEVEEEYKYHDFHGIERSIEVLRVLYVLFCRDETDNIRIVHKEK